MLDHVRAVDKTGGRRRTKGTTILLRCQRARDKNQEFIASLLFEKQLAEAASGGGLCGTE